MDVSIILVNYNTRNLTRDAINSIIEKTSGVIYEIIIIDNASTDNSVEYLKNEFSDKVSIISSDNNLGFGKANNLGIKEAKGKYVFFLNTDTYLINNAIKILFDYMESNDSIGICGGNLFDYDGKPMHSYSLRLPSLSSLITLRTKLLLNKLAKLDRVYYFNDNNHATEVGYITGADMMVRKTVLDEVGYFDPDFFMYYEETELTNRIRKRGYKVYSVPHAKIVHLEGKSFCNEKHDRINFVKYGMKIESMFLYFEKVYGFNSVKMSYYITQVWNAIYSIFKREHVECISITNDKYEKWKERLR